MTDTQEAEPAEVDAFDQAALEAIPDEVETPVESAAVEEKPLDEAPVVDQDPDIGEDPSPSGSAALMRAMDEINRARIPSALLDGKSEDEILAMGKQAAENRAQRDREFHERQTQEREASAPGAQGSDPESDAQAGGTEGADDAGTSPDLEAVRTALVEEYGEEAARPHIELLEAQAAQLKRLEASLEEERQARQLAPLAKKVDETWAEMAEQRPALSEPENRQKVEALATQLHELEPDLYKDMAPEEWIPQVLERAATTILGPVEKKADLQRRSHRQPTAPSARAKERPLTADELFDLAALEAIPDES